MAFPNGGVPDMGEASPFQANTRIVAVIALTIAGLFVFLGLALSLLRAVQQRAAERVCLPADLFRLTALNTCPFKAGNQDIKHSL